MEKSINSQPKVSIIIPVYNTGQYVKEAIESICSQTLKEIEIIVINDGSTDNCLEIINELSLIDERIQFYSQPNQGQSVARNEGIKKAQGSYLYFMDSDDFLESDALARCYEACEQQSLDFVFFDAAVWNENPENTFSMDYHRSGIEEGRAFNGMEILNKLIDTGQYRVPPWMNFIRTNYLRRIDLNFYPGIIQEDELFTAILYMEAGKVGYIHRDFFKRRLRQSSTMTQKFSWRNMNGYFTVFEQLLSYSKEKEATIIKMANKLVYTIINPVFYNARYLSFQEKIKLINICYRKGYINYLTTKSLVLFVCPWVSLLKKGLHKLK